MIYINPANNYDSLSLYTTLAHEGWPGHLYQTLYENSCGLNPVRNLFNFGGYTEGWATYVEWLSYSYAMADPKMAELKSYLGAAEILKLKEEAETVLYNDFVLKDFHTFFLSMGPAPFPVIEDYMDEWLSGP